MHISQIAVKNFRLLQDFSIDLEKEMSLLVGKNNVGKTSLLKVLYRFLVDEKTNRFKFNDFSLPLVDEIAGWLDKADEDLVSYRPLGISLRITIVYERADDIESLSHIIRSLEKDNYYAALGFDYRLSLSDLWMFRNDYRAFQEAEKKKEEEARHKGKTYAKRTVKHFLENNFDKRFKVESKALGISKAGVINEDDYSLLKDIPYFHLDDLISFKYIEARREVDNSESDKTLSTQSARLYDAIVAEGTKREHVESMLTSLNEMDSQLSAHYKDIFGKVIEDVAKFGGVQPRDMEIAIVSTLSDRNLLKGNTSVTYKHGDKDLPESFNGLGYMNLLSMIFKIEHIKTSFTRASERKPASLNLLFIEEPEAHTHPQMQYVFINNIKSLLAEGVVRKDNDGSLSHYPLQYILSTHSAHIVSNCDFEDIKYMLLVDGRSEVRNIRDLEHHYKDNKKAYAFLKQYLTIHRSELFFADKAIFIEGDTERILLPAMMKKLDEDECPEDEIPLLSQNISIIETGAYSSIYTPFIDFINMRKICVITDLDCCVKGVDKEGKPKKQAEKAKYEAGKGFTTSNASIKFYLGKKDVDELIGLTGDKKTVRLDTGKWLPDVNGTLRVCYQTEERGYCARSFEDAFFNANKELVKDKDNVFAGLKEDILFQYRAGEIDEYQLADKGVDKKSTLAVDILLAVQDKEKDGETIKVGWNIPQYIKEGLAWLRKD